LPKKFKLKKPKSVIKGSLEYMVCDDERCLPPEEVDFKIPVKAIGVEEEIAVAEPTIIPLQTEILYLKKVAKDDTLPQSKSDTVVKPVEATVTAPPTETNADSLWMTFIAGLLGGLAAVFMPCIFPLLPMTVSFLPNKQKVVRQEFVIPWSMDCRLWLSM
jgi:thiol:disulfide interchange protein DsbD